MVEVLTKSSPEACTLGAHCQTAGDWSAWLPRLSGERACEDVTGLEREHVRM